mgnify:CR=1 FL=1
MATTNQQVLRTLRRLYRIVEAGERGFATAATNANSPGLKLLFKSYAQQRANFKAEILAEFHRLGGQGTPRSSILGAVHRGRVAIFAAMTIEDDKRERTVLKEAAFGERFADQRYQQTLRHELPPEARALVERQYAEVRKVIDQIHFMLGKEGKRLLVHLFDSEQDANSALESLQRAGIQTAAIEKIPLDAAVHTYQGRGTTTLETILSGVFGGTLWGTLIGVLAGFGAVMTTSVPEMIGTASPLATWALVALTTIVIAALVGGIIGLVIGLGISEADTYIYQQSMEHGRYLIETAVDSARADEAGRILQRPNTRLGENAVSMSG